MIYEIWILIDNEINPREKIHTTMNCKNSNPKQNEKISWNFIGECKKYETIFGAFTNNIK